MSQIVYQNPGSEEVQSPLIAGITEALNKISSTLELKTGELEDVKLTPVAIDEQEKNIRRIYEANEGNRLWLSNPAPVFKKNGEVITQVKDNFSIDYVGGSITFEERSRPLETDTITVTATYIIGQSETLQEIESTLSATKLQADKYKGNYETLSALQQAHTTAKNGDFAIVFSPFAVFAWKDDTWADTRSIEDLSNYYKKSEIDNFLNQKEPTINPKGSTTNDDNYYYGGRKTWQDLFAKVRSVTLTGLSTATNTAISATDTVLSALGKLQAQVSSATAKAYIEGNGAPQTSTKGDVGQRYVNNSNGDWYTCIAASGGTYTWQKGLQDYYNKSQTDSQISTSLANYYDKTQSNGRYGHYLGVIDSPLDFNTLKQSGWYATKVQNFEGFQNAPNSVNSQIYGFGIFAIKTTATGVILQQYFPHSNFYPACKRVAYGDSGWINWQKLGSGLTADDVGAVAKDGAASKVANALTISLNGASQGDYDGSSKKSINVTATSVGALPITGGTLTGDMKAYGGTAFIVGSDSTREFRIRQNGTEFELGRYVDGTLAYACMAVRPTSFDMVFRCANPSGDVRYENGKMIYGETAEGVALYPYANGGIKLGTGTSKFGQIYSTVGTISTSDQREKNSIQILDSQKACEFIASLKAYTYKFNDGESGRTHWGLISQQVEQAMTENGITDMDFAGFIRTPLEGEDGYSYALRYDEFIAPLIAVCQSLQKEVQLLKEQVNQLKNGVELF